MRNKCRGHINDQQSAHAKRERNLAPIPPKTRPSNPERRPKSLKRLSAFAPDKSLPSRPHLHYPSRKSPPIPIDIGPHHTAKRFSS